MKNSQYLEQLKHEFSDHIRGILEVSDEEKNATDARTIVVYSGEFQPFHAGHYEIYQKLVNKFGKDNVYLVSGEEDTDDPDTPMKFTEKEDIMVEFFDIDKNHVQQVENPYIPKELLERFDAKKTSFVTVVEESDAEQLEKSEYFERYMDDIKLKPYKQAGYYLPENEVFLTVGGKKLSDAQLVQLVGSTKTPDALKDKILSTMFPHAKNGTDKVKKILNRGAKKLDGYGKSSGGKDSGGSDLKPTDAKGADTKMPQVIGPKNKPIMQRKIRNPESGRAIKIQSALKYPRWKPVYKMANQVLKVAGIDRRDRTDEPEVNQRYKARAKKSTKEHLETLLTQQITEQLLREAQTNGVCVYIDGLGEVFLKLDKPSMLVEGGAAGHLAHPYEDTDLKFSDLESMIKRSLNGGLDTEAPVTEKLDGQNIQFSYRDGKIIFARNTGHVKNKGVTALTVDGVKEKFAGRGDLEASFGNAAEDLQLAIEKLPTAQRESMFDGGGKWVNLEIINPKTKNVIPYDKNILVFHNTVRYDANGKPIELGQDEGAVLARQIQRVGADKQSTYGIQGPQNIAFSDKMDAEYKAREKDYINELNTIRNSANLSDKSTLGDYYAQRWKEEIDVELKKVDKKLSTSTVNKLVNRWAIGDKSYTAREFKGQYPELSEWFTSLDNRSAEINKKIRKPVEFLFLRMGADALARMTNFMSANNPVIADALKQEVLDVIERLKKDPSKASDLLTRELDRLESIGFDKITPTEGVVFIYGGKPYKLTGSFAPINQLMGVFKFDKGVTKTESSTANKPVVVYPGRFQPFHAGHYSVYKNLVDKYGVDNVYIGTSNKTDTNTSPFNFDEKKSIITTMFGIPSDKIVHVKNPYAPVEILSKYPDQTPFITAVSSKDADRLSNKNYFKPVPSNTSQIVGNYKDVGYVEVTPELKMNVGDGSNISGTNIRRVLSDPNIPFDKKRKTFTDLYGKFDKTVFDLIVTKLSNNATTVSTNQSVKKVPAKSTPRQTKKAVRTSPNASILNQKVRNPETNRDILVRTALNYDKKHPAYKAAQKMLQQKR